MDTKDKLSKLMEWSLLYDLMEDKHVQVSDWCLDVCIIDNIVNHARQAYINVFVSFQTFIYT